MRDPVTQKVFEREFNTTGLSSSDAMWRCEELLIEMRKEAGALAGQWLAENGYFNGDIDSSIHPYDLTHRCVVRVILRCFGLPLRVDEDQSRAVEACRRYFDHCERVSVTAEGKDCNSIEMAVRMSLKSEARNAVMPNQPEVSGE